MALQPICRRWLASAGFLLLVTAGVAAVTAPARYVRYAEAEPILSELAVTGALPSELGSLAGAQREAAWPGWIERHDKDIRARLEQGDEDTIVNWLLFGTSFTTRPRAILGAVESDSPASAADREVILRRTIELIGARLDDLLKALAAPGTDERRLFARRLLERKGQHFGTDAGLDGVRQYLLGAVMRMAQEQEQFDQELGATSGDSIAEFIQRSRLFRTRGLSLDTSLLPNYALEQSMAAMKARGLLRAGEVKRVAIIGPGLDFADKDVGFDFYPQQTVQPFAVLDSIKRLGLGPPSPGGPEIVLFDISPRVIDHVTQARARAVKGTGYTLHLPLPRATSWLPEVRKYWEAFGGQIGAPAQAAASKAILDQVELRAVRATPAAVQRLSVANLNIVTERLDGEAFDLVIATNVFIYYDVLEQALAMANVEAMLKPGAFLLANVAAPRVRALTIRPVDTQTTVYARATNHEDILDFMVWYQAHAQ